MSQLATLKDVDVIRILGMEPHPIEGGHYVESYHDRPMDGGLGDVTCIYFLLRANERSRWHRNNAHEIWLFHAGSAVELTTWTVGQPIQKHVVGPDLAAGQRPQALVPAGVWQTATPLCGWGLVACVVSPAFQFSGLEFAPEEWTPDDGIPPAGQISILADTEQIGLHGK